MERLYNNPIETGIHFLIDAGLKDSDYVESLNWARNICVINYSPYIKYPELLRSPTSFLLKYEARQNMLLNQIAQIAEYVREQKLGVPQDIKREHVPVLRGFITNADIFFAQTTYFGLKVKNVEDTLYLSLKKKYPHLDPRLLLTPSWPVSPVIKILKAAEFFRGKNDDFTGMFCSGNKELALKVAKKIQTADMDVYETAIQSIIEKGYFMQGRNDIKMLDRILILDNTIENLIWKDSWMTAPLYHIYNLAQEMVCPSKSFVKEKYVFDIKMIRDNF